MVPSELSLILSTTKIPEDIKTPPPSLVPLKPELRDTSQITKTFRSLPTSPLTFNETTSKVRVVG